MSAAPAASPHRFLRSETIDKLCHSPLHGEPPSHWFVILPLLHKPLQVPDQKTSPTTGLSTNPVKHLGRLHGVQLESKERKGCGHPTLEDSLQSKDQHLSPSLPFPKSSLPSRKAPLLLKWKVGGDVLWMHHFLLFRKVCLHDKTIQISTHTFLLTQTLGLSFSCLLLTCWKNLHLSGCLGRGMHLK